MKQKFPAVNIMEFSPSEFVHFRDVFQEPLEKILSTSSQPGSGRFQAAEGRFS
jgi:hypothetical protein